MNVSSLSFKVAIFVGVLLVLLLVLLSAASALTPFILGAVIAYISTPLMNGLEKRGLPTVGAAAGIVLLWLVLLIALPFALLPLINSQIKEIAELLPSMIAKAEALLGYDIRQWLGEQDLQALVVAGASTAGVASGAKSAAQTLFAIGGSGLSFVVGLLMTLLITPLSAFYFLKDRKSIGGELTDILPLTIREPMLNFMHDLDSVMDEFLHGQLLVIVVMSVIYSLLLYFAGLNFAVTIGVISGIFVFIPYVGFLLGISLATLIGLTAFDSWTDILIVWLLMGIGTTVESLLITPKLVGERVGLHPIAVLLALFILGEWFGFIGLLISVPMAAILLVCVRQLRRNYISSELYR